MAALAFVTSILPGKQEAWRRFYQALEGSRRQQYEEFHKRLRITKELAWLTQTPQGDMAIVYLEADYPERMIPDLAASKLSFDCWFKEQLLELYGLDVQKQQAKQLNELVFAWSRPS
ncbi:MAG: hypothetical protein NVSMB27_35910 [Ktedonobacteraceae bacterium]